MNLSAVELIAHRGASAIAPENTLSAIRAAQNALCPFIEIDIHMTQDKKIVALHDLSVNRTTDGRGKISELTYDQIKILDAGSWFNKKFSAESIPLLSQVLDEIKGSSLIIEFKYGESEYPGITKKVVDLIRQKNLEKKVILKSFSRDVLKEFKTIAPQIPRLYVALLSNPFFSIDNGLKIGPITKVNDVNYYQVHQLFLTRSLIQKVHKLNKKIIVWGVNSKQKAKKFIDLGVDFIETDDPRLLD